MQYTTLGRTGLKVSRICLGTMNFGTVTDEKTSFAIMDRALELGINLFDTADFYGDPLGHGRTEEIVGRWLKADGHRDKVVLATKLYATMGSGVNDRGLSAYHIRAACQGSLKRLQTDHIDLYQVHHIDRGIRSLPELRNIGRTEEFDLKPRFSGGYETPWEEIWQGMERLILLGDIIYAGSCNLPAWNIALANAAAERRNLLGLVSEQSIYSLSSRMVELEVIPACRALGLGLLPYSPLGGGLLGGALKKASEGRRASLIPGARMEAVERYERLCAGRGLPPANVALAWLLSNPAVTAPIIGPRTVEQLESAAGALDIALSSEDLAELDKIWPGPGGEAPEAYAW